MGPSVNCPEVCEQLALFLRDELAAPERDALQSHLDTCDQCRAELELIEETLGGLQGLGVPSPPAEMRANVLATVEAEALAPLLVNAVEPPNEALRATVLAAVAREPVNDTDSAQVLALRPRWTRFAQFTAAAAVLVAGIVIGSAVMTPSDPSGSDRDVPRGHQTQVMALEGTGPSSATVDHYRHDNFRVTFSVEGYGATPPGFHYAVWVRGESGDVTIGTFRLQRADDFEIPFALGVNPTEYPELVVTIEPNDGDPRLTGEVVTRGEFDPDRVLHGTYED